jgi:hypothetical protein
LAVVFNQWRGIEPDPERRGEAADGILENHDPRGLSMRRYGNGPTRVTQAIEKHCFGEKIKEKTNGPI